MLITKTLRTDEQAMKAAFTASKLICLIACCRMSCSECARAMVCDSLCHTVSLVRSKLIAILCAIWRSPSVLSITSIVYATVELVISPSASSQLGFREGDLTTGCTRLGGAEVEFCGERVLPPCSFDPACISSIAIRQKTTSEPPGSPQSLPVLVKSPARTPGTRYSVLRW